MEVGRDWFCTKQSKEVIDIIDGTTWFDAYPVKAVKVRKNKKLCGPEGKWFESIFEQDK